jgi:uncharacterized protein (TIGR02118 family)
MIQIAALVSPLGSFDKEFSVSSLIDRLSSEWSPEGRRDPAVRGLVVSEVLKYLTEIKDVKAMIQLWWDVPAVGPEGIGRILPDVSPGTSFRAEAFVVKEHVFREPVEREQPDGSDSGVKLAGTAYRRDDFSREAFFEYWSDVHAPISGSVPGLGGYVVSELLESLSGTSSADALLELWWPDEATFERSGDSPKQAEAWEDVGRYAKTTGTFWLMREHVLIAPPPTGPGLLEVDHA